MIADFGFAKLGTTYGLMQCAGALLNLAMPLITRAVLAAGGSWAPVFWSLLAVCVPQLLLVTWAVRTLGDAGDCVSNLWQARFQKRSAVTVAVPRARCC